jgi:hypothetical protein
MRDLCLAAFLLPLLASGVVCIAQQTRVCNTSYAGSADHFDCGQDKLNNAYVFVGTVRAVHPAPEDEKYVEIVPDEVFLGDPGHLITALTMQGRCFDLVVGQQWLFYLRNIDGKIVLEYNMWNSAPVSEMSFQLETLRRLKNLVGTGLLRGTVVRDLTAFPIESRNGRKKDDANAVPGAHITAVRRTDQATFSAVSSKDGSYEFPPLPVGDYEIEVDPIGNFHAVDSSAGIKEGECREVILYNSREARFSGHVLWPSGKPAVNAGVFLVGVDGSSVYTRATDEEGRFSFDHWGPGSFVIGALRPGASKFELGACERASCSDKLPANIYYFGNTAQRNDALVIKLGVDEKRDDIEIVFPPIEPKTKP